MRVKRGTGKIASGLEVVFAVTQERIAFFCGLDPDLVGTARLQDELDQAHRTGIPDSVGEVLHGENGFLGARGPGRNHPDDVIALVLLKKVSPAGGAFEASLDPGDVRAENFALLEGPREAFRRLRSLGDDHDSGCITVEPVNQSHVGTAKILAQPIDQVLISRLFALAEESGGLRQHQQVGVFEQDLGFEIPAK